jgi:hypothetical protein
VPSYTVGYIDVYRNGVKLGTADFTATSGTTVVLASGATAGDLVETISFFVSSVLNAIPAVANAVTETYINTGAVTQSKLGAGVAGNGPAFSAYQNVQQTGISAATATKVTYDAEEFDTNSNFASSRFTPTVAGYYQIGGSVYASSATIMVFWLYKNGSVYRTFGNTNNANGTCLSGNSLCYANGTTDYFEMYVYLGGGGSLDVTNSSRNWFTGALVRAA